MLKLDEQLLGPTVDVDPADREEGAPSWWFGDEDATASHAAALLGMRP